MNGINFSFNEDAENDAFDDLVKLIRSIYLESDSWDFQIEITKEKGTYNVWIGDKEE